MPSSHRPPPTERTYDIVVVGGGMAGIAAAVSAARQGSSVSLLHERPVLGGNASSEVRVNLEGANGGFHNRYFVESGIAEDMLLENLWRNPTGSADIWSALLLDVVLAEERLDLHLDTHVHDVEIDDNGSLVAVHAVTLGSERAWRMSAPVFVDATGDGSIAAWAGAESMRGEEAQARFAEPLAPSDDRPYTLGGTIQFMCKDTGREVPYVPPAFARQIAPHEPGRNRTADVWVQNPVLGGFWWLEYGGDLDTIADNAEIKHALLSEVYGMWDHVKNGTEWRDRNARLDLEWVGAVPGKRESRRIVGDVVLTEHHVLGTTRWEDGVAFGGWSIDRHPPRGFLDVDEPPCVQIHPPGLYQIPLRALYARDVTNLFLAGRDISATHIACCSTRVMLTCAHIGEAVGVAASLAVEHGFSPRQIAGDADALDRIHETLDRLGHYVPHRPVRADRPPVGTRTSASSVGTAKQTETTTRLSLARPRLLSVPVNGEQIDAIRIWLSAPHGCVLAWRLYEHGDPCSWLPADERSRGSITVQPGTAGWIAIPLSGIEMPTGYVHLGLAAEGDEVQLGAGDTRPLGPLSWRSESADLDARPIDRRKELGWHLPQHEEAAWGDSTAFVFSYWRRDGHGWGGPPGAAIAYVLEPERPIATVDAVLEPFERPTPRGIHAWVGEPAPGHMREGQWHFIDPEWLALDLDGPRDVSFVEVYFNSDVDRHLANLWYSHPPGRRAMPTLVSAFAVDVRVGDSWDEVARVDENHLRRRRIPIERTIEGMRIRCFATHGERYASIVDVRIALAGDAAADPSTNEGT